MIHLLHLRLLNYGCQRLCFIFRIHPKHLLFVPFCLKFTRNFFKFLKPEHRIRMSIMGKMLFTWARRGQLGPVIAQLAVFVSQVSFITWTNVCKMLRNNKSWSLHYQVVKTLHECPFEFSHQINQRHQKRSCLCPNTMNDHTVMHP